MHLFLIFYGLMFLQSCSGDLRKSSSINVSVAASVEPAIKNITAEFEKECSCKINLQSSSTGKIAAQILNGAPIDVFLAADTSYLTDIVNSGYGKDIEIYGRGKLLYWERDSATSNFNKVAIADPRIAPFGQLAQKYLEENQLWTDWQQFLVFGESVGQVNHYISSDVVDKALTAATLFYRNDIKLKGTFKVIKSYQLPHGLLRLSDKDLSVEFVNFVHSSKGKAILKEFGID